MDGVKAASAFCREIAAKSAGQIQIAPRTV
jgi:hypothetical protein